MIAMCLLKTLVLLSLISTVFCGKVGYSHHHGLYYREFAYLIFLALKFKIILVVGSLWIFGLVIAKVFALFKISEYMKSKQEHHEVIFSNPHHGSLDYPTGGVYGKNYIESAPQQVYFDHAPSASGSYPNYDTSNQPPTGYAEKLGKGRSFAYNFIESSNVTEKVFEEMKITTAECKRRFLCEAEFNAGTNVILRYAFRFLSDESYWKYKTYKKLKSIEDCSKLHECDSNG